MSDTAVFVGLLVVVVVGVAMWWQAWGKGYDEGVEMGEKLGRARLENEALRAELKRLQTPLPSQSFTEPWLLALEEIRKEVEKQD